MPMPRSNIRVEAPALWAPDPPPHVSAHPPDAARTPCSPHASHVSPSVPPSLSPPSQTLPELLHNLQCLLPDAPALSPDLLTRVQQNKQLRQAIGEVFWRAKALRAQIKPRGAILFVPLRPVSSQAAGTCDLCGDPLPAGGSARCAACVIAARLALGYLSLEEWVSSPVPERKQERRSLHYVVMQRDAAGKVTPETSLLCSQAHTLVNPVNCVGTMGKGLAAQFKQRYPELFARYERVCQAGRLQPGMVWPYRAQDHLILCVATKDHYHDPSRIEWIEDILERIVQHHTRLDMRSLALPKLGCGEGQLSWERVGPLMARALSSLPCDVFLYVEEDDPHFEA